MSLSDYFKLPDGESNSELENIFIHNNGSEYSPDADFNSVSVFDKDWIDSSFIAPLSSLAPNMKRVALTQTAFFKFKSCRLGGNIAVNMPPGSNILADPLADGGFRIVGLRPDTGMAAGMSYGPMLQNVGMGRWYSDNIDDHTQTVILQFGLPRFNSLISFLGSSMSYMDSYIATKGEIPVWYQASLGIFTGIRAYTMPLTSLLIYSVKLGFTLFTGNKPYSYYYLDPMMPMYWSTVNDIANYFAAKLGIMKPVVEEAASSLFGFELRQKGDKESQYITTGKAYRLDPKLREIMRVLYGGRNGDSWWDETIDFIDVYDMVTRRQYLFNEVRRQVLKDMMKNGDSDKPATTEDFDTNKLGKESFTGTEEDDRKAVYNYLQSMLGSINDYGDSVIEKVPKFDNFSPKELSGESVLNAWGEEKYKASKLAATPADEKKLTDEEKAKLKEKKQEIVKSTDPKNTYSSVAAGGYTAPVGSNGLDQTDGGASAWDWAKAFAGTCWDKMIAGFTASARGASSAAVFAINPTGPGSDSFSNSTGSISTGDMVKSLSRAAHDAKFSLGGGQTGVDTIDFLLDKLMQVGAGALEAYTFGLSNLINGIINGGYVDVPDKWEDSSFNGNQVTYTMDLVSPYGNEFSRFHNLFVPLAMILAGALPRGIGKAGYTQPFLCSAYSKSTQQISLGMITDVTVSSGITNQAFVNGVKTNSLRITFTIKDLSNIMVGRVNTSSLFGQYVPVIEEDTPLARWVNRLAGVDYDDLTYVMPRLETNFNIFGKSLANMMDATRIGNTLGSALVDQTILSGLFKNPHWTSVMTANE